MLTQEKVCAPIERTKQSIGGGTLYLVDCTCGARAHNGSAWFADPKRAWRAYERRRNQEDT